MTWVCISYADLLLLLLDFYFLSFLFACATVLRNLAISIGVLQRKRTNGMNMNNIDRDRYVCEFTEVSLHKNSSDS